MYTSNSVEINDNLKVESGFTELQCKGLERKTHGRLLTGQERIVDVIFEKHQSSTKVTDLTHSI